MDTWWLHRFWHFNLIFWTFLWFMVMKQSLSWSLFSRPRTLSHVWESPLIFPDLLQIRNGVTESLYPSISVSSLLNWRRKAIGTFRSLENMYRVGDRPEKGREIGRGCLLNKMSYVSRHLLRCNNMHPSVLVFTWGCPSLGHPLLTADIPFQFILILK